MTKIDGSSFVKKAAVVATVAAVAGSAVYAIKKGQLPDTFEGGKAKEVATKLGDGYKKLGGVLFEGAKAAGKKVVEVAKDLKDKAVARFGSAAEVVEDVAEEVAENI